MNTTICSKLIVIPLLLTTNIAWAGDTVPFVDINTKKQVVQCKPMCLDGYKYMGCLTKDGFFTFVQEYQREMPFPQPKQCKVVK